MKDLANNIKMVQSLAPAVVASDTNGSGVDLLGFESASVVVDTGAEGVTLSSSVKIDFKLEESDDDSTYTAVTSNDSVSDGAVDSNGIFLTLDDNAESPQIMTIGYLGSKRYIRVVADLTGSHSTGTAMSASVILSHARHSSDASSNSDR